MWTEENTWQPLWDSIVKVTERRVGAQPVRALQLINVLFDLGMPERDCKLHIISKNAPVAPTAVAKALDGLCKAVNKTQQDRNVIAHRRSFDHGDLFEVEAHSVLQKSSGDTAEDVLSLLGLWAKQKADAFVRARRLEMEGMNAAVYHEVANLFDTLVQPFKDRHAAQPPCRY